MSSPIPFGTPCARRNDHANLTSLIRAGAAGVVWLAAASSAMGQELPVVRIDVINPALAETNPVPAQIVFTRVGDTTLPLTVNFTIGGSAKNGADYYRLPRRIVIPAGESAATLEVKPVADGLVEDLETLTVQLTSPTAPFTIAVLPDTQYYTSETRDADQEMFTSQTDWIVDQADAQNIAFVLHEGDCTEFNTAPEWARARDAMNRLDGVVPYAIAVGNHDGLDQASPRTGLFNEYFPLSKFQSAPGFGGVFESNRMDNCYHFFTAGGIDWLVLVLEFGPRDSVLEWANDVVTNHPNHRVIVVTHSHVYFDNTLHGSSTNHLVTPKSYGRFNNGPDVWEKFLRHHANVAFVFNGHNGGPDGQGRLVGVADPGNRIYQMLCNFQFDWNGGSGFLRLIRCFPDEDRFEASTFSPYLARSRAYPPYTFEYTKLGIFTNNSAGYLIDPSNATVNLTISSDDTDVTPPGIVSVAANGRPAEIVVLFNEEVEASSATNLENYAVSPPVPLTGSILLADSRTVLLLTGSRLSPKTNYTLTVQGVSDLAAPANTITAPVDSSFKFDPALLRETFDDVRFTGWRVVDEGSVEAPSNWLVGNRALRQLSNIYGPTAAATVGRLGTYVYWDKPRAFLWGDYAFSVLIGSGDDDGLGVFFRYQDPGNYYKFEMDAQRNFRKLLKRVNGIETTLATTNGGYAVGPLSTLRVEASGDQLTVAFNGQTLFGGAVTDPDLSTGSVALYCWGNSAARFDDVIVTPSNRPPSVTLTEPVPGSHYVEPASVTLTAEASDAEDGISMVEFFVGSLPPQTVTAPPYTASFQGLAAGTYSLSARVTDDLGAAGESSPFQVVVDPVAGVVILPPGQTLIRGGNGAFRARVIGPVPSGYQWRRNDTDIIGATRSVLLFNDVQTVDAGAYTVRITNNLGEATSPAAMLTVINPHGQPLPPDGPVPPLLRVLSLSDDTPPVLAALSAAGQVLTLEASPDLHLWLPLTTMTNVTGIFWFDDPSADGEPARFYRLRLEP